VIAYYLPTEECMFTFMIVLLALFIHIVVLYFMLRPFLSPEL